MAGTICALFILWFQPSSTEAEASRLITQLGSTKYAEREAAAQGLEKLGRGALPALRTAQDSKDLEIRTRSVALVRKIEGTLLSAPTMLRLDFQDTPVSDVIRSLTEQSGIRVNVVPESNPRIKAQRLTLHLSEPVPFWKGLDLVCQAADLRLGPGMISSINGREPFVMMTLGGPPSVLPISDHGPFRVNLMRIHTERDISFGPHIGLPRPIQGGLTNFEPANGASTSPLRPTSVVNVQFNFQLMVSAEPRLTVMQGGTPRLTEASDDQGNSLLVATGGGTDQPVIMSSRFPRPAGLGSGHQFQLVIPLKRPDSPGKSIRVIKGSITVIAASRRPNPLVVPLDKSDGKTFENRESSVAVHGVRKNAPQTQTMIDLTFRSTSEGAVPDLRADVNVGGDVMIPGGNNAQQEIEVLDGNGRLIPWFQTATDPDSSRMTMTLNQFGGVQMEPKEIRVYSLTKAITEIPFEFRDLPMP